MAGLTQLLRYERVSNRRSLLMRRSGGEQLAELCVGIILVAALFLQLAKIAFGPQPARLPAAQLLILVLAIAWAIAPSTVLASIPARALALYPFTSLQKAWYRVCSYLQNGQVLAIFLASILAMIALVRVPHPLIALAQAAALLAFAAAAGLGLAIALSTLQNRADCVKLTATVPNPRRYPLFGMNIRYFARTLDPYLALLLSIAAGISEYLGSWITPAKFILPLLLLAVLYIPAVLNPFGLEKPAERSRYRLLPAPYWKLLRQKHLALASLFFASTLPLDFALVCRMTLPELCLSALQIGTVLLCWLLTGLSLMRLPSSRQIKLAFGTISGSNMTVMLAFHAAVLMAVVPLSEALIFRCVRPAIAFPVELGVLMALAATYALLIRRQRWPVERLQSIQK